MDRFVIEGPSKLSGVVNISGAKNSALAILFATILTDEKCILENVPDLDDIKTASAILEYCGKTCIRNADLCKVIEKTPLKQEAPYDLVRKMRASVLIAGPMLSRYGYVRFSMPGGCAIGVRPIDIHLDGFRKLGADIRLDSGYVILKAKRLRPAIINLRFPSVGATENIMMAASLIDGKTIIKNAAMEPEISDVAQALRKMGVFISGDGSKEIVIVGRKKLNGFTYRVIPDRIEAGTFMILGLMCGKNLEIKNVRPDHLSDLINKIKKAGGIVDVGLDSIVVKGTNEIKPVSIKTEPYPKFPTDLQAQWMAAMSIANGRSKIVENIFENRFMHVAELIRMGADINIKHNSAYINGVKKLIGATVMASDLRAGAGLVLAGCVAEGKTYVRRIYHIDRGYEKMERKLSKIGVKIKREEE